MNPLQNESKVVVFSIRAARRFLQTFFDKERRPLAMRVQADKFDDTVVLSVIVLTAATITSV